jgi:hypothetical protein
VSTKVKGETREGLGQSAKRSAAVRGQARRGSYWAGPRLPGPAEQNVDIFCLPGLGFSAQPKNKQAPCQEAFAIR